MKHESAFRWRWCWNFSQSLMICRSGEGEGEVQSLPVRKMPRWTLNLWTLFSFHQWAGLVMMKSFFKMIMHPAPEQRALKLFFRKGRSSQQHCQQTDQISIRLKIYGNWKNWKEKKSPSCKAHLPTAVWESRTLTDEEYFFHEWSPCLQLSENPQEVQQSTNVIFFGSWFYHFFPSTWSENKSAINYIRMFTC